MTTSRDILQSSADVAFEVQGEEATYTPKGGGPVVVRVIPRQPDEVVEFGATRLVSSTTLFDVRMSEVADPVKGDSLVYAGLTFVVQGEPTARKARRLVWTLDTRPA